MIKLQGKKIFSIFALTLFALSIGIVALWIISINKRPIWIFQGATVGSSQYGIQLLPGYIDFWRVGPVPVMASPVYELGMYDGNRQSVWGISIIKASVPDSGPEAFKYHWMMVGLPIWWLLIPTLSLLVLWILFCSRSVGHVVGFYMASHKQA